MGYALTTECLKFVDALVHGADIHLFTKRTSMDNGALKGAHHEEIGRLDSYEIEKQQAPVVGQ